VRIEHFDAIPANNILFTIALDDILLPTYTPNKDFTPFDVTVRLYKFDYSWSGLSYNSAQPKIPTFH